jgi:Spy/CpxP family protein refolding chaperone
MNTLKTLTLALLITCLAMTPAHAKRHGGDRPFNLEEHRMEQFEQLKEALELTPQQQAEIRAILTESRQEMMDRRGAVLATRAEVRDVFAAAALDESRLRELLLKQAELRADQLVAQHAVRARVTQTLTTEQQARWEEFRRQRMDHGAGKRPQAKQVNRSAAQRACDTAKGPAADRGIRTTDAL